MERQKDAQADGNSYPREQYWMQAAIAMDRHGCSSHTALSGRFRIQGTNMTEWLWAGNICHAQAAMI